MMGTGNRRITSHLGILVLCKHCTVLYKPVNIYKTTTSVWHEWVRCPCCGNIPPPVLSAEKRLWWRCCAGPPANTCFMNSVLCSKHWKIYRNSKGSKRFSKETEERFTQFACHVALCGVSASVHTLHECVQETAAFSIACCRRWTTCQHSNNYSENWKSWNLLIT